MPRKDKRNLFWQSKALFKPTIMTIKVPELSLIVLIGASGSGKSTFARKHFKATEIVSSDACRAIVSDDENNQAATPDAFDLLNYIIAKRLKRGLLTVVDATSVQPESRKSLIALARQYHCLPVAIVLNIHEKISQERNDLRPDRNFGEHVIRIQKQQLRKSIGKLKHEGFRHIFILDTPEEVEAVEAIVREPLHNDRKREHGPCDIIGDVHGCLDELLQLLHALGYEVKAVEDDGRNFGFDVVAPAGRKAVFLGDLVDRGPNSPGVLKLVMSMVNSRTALCVPGNHDMKLFKKLSGKNVSLTHGLAETMDQLSHEKPEFIGKVMRFLDKLVSHYVLDGGNLVVAHAGMREEMQGRGSGAVRSFAMYGETTGETDEFGLPVRYNWALEYRGKAMVIYGHTPVPEAQWLNNTIDIDTGCVFGGKLTALQYPEKTFVSVPAQKEYAVPSRPFIPQVPIAPSLTMQQEHDELLDIDLVLGKRIIDTSLTHKVTIREENAAAALEIMSRFAVDPRWLIYLPPTMSPSETSQLQDFLEHPREALQYYEGRGVERVICEEKHMGSRAIVVMCRDEAAARKRFGITDERVGICYTRTGRNFFNDAILEKQFLLRVQNALTVSSFWEKLQTDWVCLDTELMPWSAKAQALIQNQFASVGAASQAALPDVVKALQQTAQRGIEIGTLLNKFEEKQTKSSQFVEAYRRYCWPVASIDDYRLAPFHIMATEGKVHVDKDHMWHMETIREICQADPDWLVATPYQMVNLNDPVAVDEAISWWEELTAKGGEGIVIKPFQFLAKGKKDLFQPAIKCRGKEYLRIIYGPEYDVAENLERLKQRGLSAKRSLAIREFVLGVEGLDRFVARQPLSRVHECVFGVLALESEPLDPRL